MIETSIPGAAEAGDGAASPSAHARSAKTAGIERDLSAGMGVWFIGIAETNHEPRGGRKVALGRRYAPAVRRSFSHPMRVRWAECDPQGAVFNGNYLIYFDVALTELWREAIGRYDEMVESGVDMVMAEVRVRYLAPVLFDDEIDVRVELTRLGTTAMSTRMTIERGGAPTTEGELRHVFIDTASRSKTAMPDHIRSSLEPYLAGVVARPG